VSTPRARDAEQVDELLAQDAHGDGVDEKRPLAAEADHPSLGVELKELAEIEVFGAHGHSIDLRDRSIITRDPLPGNAS